jgi:hypothetical protein
LTKAIGVDRIIDIDRDESQGERKMNSAESQILETQVEKATRRYQRALEDAIFNLNHELTGLKEGRILKNLETSQLTGLQDLIRKSGELNALLVTKYYAESRSGRENA